MFKEEREALLFKWEDLGDIAAGRPNLGDMTTVTIYRLMQYTLRDVLVKRFGPTVAGEIMCEAGRQAGYQFCVNVLDTDLEFDEFIAELQKVLKEQRIGILRVEHADLENLKLVMTVAEDLDCSGLPVSYETVCDYDEGFLSGVLEAYTGKKFDVKEIDCWASGERVCRFNAEKKAS